MTSIFNFEEIRCYEFLKWSVSKVNGVVNGWTKCILLYFVALLVFNVLNILDIFVY